MRNPRIHWLFLEVQSWQKSGLISDYQAAAIRSRYVSKSFSTGRRSQAAFIWSLLGGFSVCLGIVLVIANFWPGLGRMVRLLIAIGPLVGSWAALIVMLWRQKQSIQWREGVAFGNLLASVVAMGLIDQLYNVQLPLGAFCITVIACSLPVLFLTRSIAWLVGTGVLVNIALVDSEGIGLRLIILAFASGMLIVPDMLFRQAPEWLKTGIAWCVTLGFSAAMVWMAESLHSSAFTILPVMIWSTVIGLGAYSSHKWAIRVPMVAVSAVGLFMSLFLGSFASIWDEWILVSIVETPLFIMVLGGLLGVQLSLFAVIRTHWFRWCLVIPSVMFLLGMMIVKFLPIWVFPTLFLCIVSGFLTASIRFGVMQHNRWWINGGLIGFVMIMMAKFFGVDFPIGIRAASFLISGGILIAIGYRLNQWTLKS